MLIKKTPYRARVKATARCDGGAASCNGIALRTDGEGNVGAGPTLAKTRGRSRAQNLPPRLPRPEQNFFQRDWTCKQAMESACLFRRLHSDFSSECLSACSAAPPTRVSIRLTMGDLTDQPWPAGHWMSNGLFLVDFPLCSTRPP